AQKGVWRCEACDPTAQRRRRLRRIARPKWLISHVSTPERIANGPRGGNGGEPVKELITSSLLVFSMRYRYLRRHAVRNDRYLHVRDVRSCVANRRAPNSGSGRIAFSNESMGGSSWCRRLVMP